MSETSLPIYEMILDDDGETGINYISIVEEPAIEQSFIALNTNTKLKAYNDEKHLALGPLVVPDQKIYRFDLENGEYYITFSKETIEKIRDKFFIENNITNINVNHKKRVSNCTVVETWIIEDSKNDKANHLGYDLPAGTLMVGVKVEDPETWKQIKTNKLTGFSLEGVFNQNKLNLNMFKSLTKKLTKAVSKAARSKVNLGSVHTISRPEGLGPEWGETVTIVITDTGIVNVLNPVNGETEPLMDGVYTLEDGSELAVLNGEVAVESVDAEKEYKEDEEEELQEITQEAIYTLANGYVLSADSDGVLYYVDFYGNYQPLVDGIYQTVDNMQLEIIEGRVYEATELEAVEASNDRFKFALLARVEQLEKALNSTINSMEKLAKAQSVKVVEAPAKVQAANAMREFKELNTIKTETTNRLQAHRARKKNIKNV